MGMNLIRQLRYYHPQGGGLIGPFGSRPHPPRKLGTFPRGEGRGMGDGEMTIKNGSLTAIFCFIEVVGRAPGPALGRVWSI